MEMRAREGAVEKSSPNGPSPPCPAGRHPEDSLFGILKELSSCGYR